MRVSPRRVVYKSGATSIGHDAAAAHPGDTQRPPVDADFVAAAGDAPEALLDEARWRIATHLDALLAVSAVRA